MASKGQHLITQLVKALALPPDTPLSTVWLAIGDFNNFKDLNSLYGRAIMDALLKQARALIRDRAARFRGPGGKESPEVTFVGDEAALVFPRSQSDGAHLTHLLEKVQHALEGAFRERHIVACLSGIEAGQGTSPTAFIASIRHHLEEKGIILDPLPRSAGHLVLFSRESGESSADALRRVTKEVGKHLPAGYGEAVKATTRWLFNRQTGSFEEFNSGKIWPLTISFGVISSRQALHLAGIDHEAPFGEEHLSKAAFMMFELAQHNLKRAKSLPHRISLDSVTSDIGSETRELLKVTLAPFRPYNPRRVKYPIISEEFLKTVVNNLNRAGERGVLLHAEPVYSLALGDRLKAVSRDILRGDEYGIGLKGINDLLGYEMGDKVICLLESAFFRTMARFRKGRRAKAQQVHIARFIDSFTVYFSGLSLKDPSLVKLMRKIIACFNSHARKLSLSRLSVSVVQNRERVESSILFKRLERTMRSPGKARTACQEQDLIIRHFTPDVEEEARILREEEAWQSASRLLKKPLR
ncbi:MAG: hypothetical protein RDV48_00330 [Candidatus Eremiobacteraeota bacterium]|nr:hypothetical protein [Candidatus Eremiobacteraeota bacterium]